MDWYVVLAVFFIGVVITLFTAIFLGGLSIGVAVCYVGALILGRMCYKEEK